jgi:hypothetical protein
MYIHTKQKKLEKTNRTNTSHQKRSKTGII